MTVGDAKLIQLFGDVYCKMNLFLDDENTFLT